MSELHETYNTKFFSHIPRDWKLEKLKGLVKTGKKITYGIVQPGKYDPKGILLIRGQDYMNGWVDNTKFFRVSPELHQKYKRSTTSAGDVLLSIAGYTGIVAVVPPWIKEANLTQTTARIACDPQKLEGMYLSYFLQSDDGQLQSKRYTKGSAQEGLNLEDIERFIVTLPPLPEQQKIATILSSVDKVIETTRAQIDKLKDLKTGMMQELLTKGIGHTEFKESPVGRVPASWHVSTLGELVTKVGSGVTPKGGSSTYVDFGIPLIRSQNVHSDGLRLDDVSYITEQQHQKMSNSQLKPHDVLLNITGASIGRCYYLPAEFGEGNVNQHVCIIRGKKNQINSTFLTLFMNSEFGQRQIMSLQAGGNREGLNFQQVRAIKLPVPVLSEQERIAHSVSSIECHIQNRRSKLSQIMNVKKALMQDLLTGKVRVNVDNYKKEERVAV